jgi:SNF2 family DNA or RNA helicase
MAKIKDIAALANDIEEPLVIMVHHKEVVSELMKLLKKKKPEKLVGGMTPKKRQESIDKFQNGDTDVLVASMTAAGVGINLQRGSQMIMGELPFTYAEVDQAESRCHRSGSKNDLTVHRVVGLGTFDETILNIIARKESVSAAVEDGNEIAVVKTDDIIARKLLEIYKGEK